MDNFQLIVLGLATILGCSYGLNCNSNADCVPYGGTFSECVGDTCGCQEFFTFVNLTTGASGECAKMASYGNKCKYDEQCQATMGDLSYCEPLMESCDCKNSSMSDVVPMLLQGRCLVPKTLGEACTDSNECKLGSASEGTMNEFASCINNICACGMNHDLLLHTMASDGLCMNHCESCTNVEISVFAITMIAASLTFLLVFASYNAIKKNK